MARNCHKIRQKYRFIPCRCANQMYRSLGKYLMTTLSSYSGIIGSYMIPPSPSNGVVCLCSPLRIILGIPLGKAKQLPGAILLLCLQVWQELWITLTARAAKWSLSDAGLFDRLRASLITGLLFSSSFIIHPFYYVINVLGYRKNKHPFLSK